MDAALELPIQSPPPGRRPAFALRPQPGPLQRNPSLPKPQSPRAPRDARSRRTPPSLPREGERMGTRAGKPKARISPKAAPKSLLPATERRSQEENKLDRRARKESDVDKGDITPDGGSAGRDGRQFAVANVGNNGRIYLRPTVRPAHQRYPQPNFVFPMTPPGTAGLDTLAPERQGQDDEAVDDSFRHGSQWTATYNPSSPAAARRQPFLLDSDTPPRGHRRALSDSTIPDTSVARESDVGGFKIVITQPGDGQRPRTLEEAGPGSGRLLDVTIPSFKLGSPRFTLRGTPLIQGSSYAPTEEFRSSNPSLLARTPRNASPRVRSYAFRPGPVTIPGALPGEHELGGSTAPRGLPRRTTYLSTHLVIEPSMFDALTFPPTCNDRAIVRVSSATLAVTAATPPRLVAEITSPKFVDYELVSDFFLTFRAFLETRDLLRMLLARLRWAMARDDEIGMIVRVRTFVALRHWILNYFVDDFIVDYELRILFCHLLNAFCGELANDLRRYKGQLKILGELKKCWRKVCAQYWDGPEFDSLLGPDVPIAPGGIAGHRDPGLSPCFWEQQDPEAGPPQLGAVFVPADAAGQNSFYADVSRAGHIDSIVLDGRPGTPENQEVPPGAPERSQASPTSITSFDVVSCSFPTKNMRFVPPGGGLALAAHPVDPSSVYVHADPIATTPRALMGKRVRPHHTHKRNASLTDSLREHTSTAEKLIYKNTEFLMTLPYAGSLVRGALLPPGHAFVEVIPPGAAGGPSRQTTLFQQHPLESEKEKASAMSGQGMKKLLGSVRRALSTKGTGISPTQGNFINISPIGPQGATTNRLPGTAIVPQARPRLNGVRPPVRIDLLGAEVAEDFKKAVREDAAAEAAKQDYSMPSPRPPKVPGEMLEYSAAHMDTLLLLPDDTGPRPISDTGITAGSKSIVIVDDTVPNDFPLMAGALPVVNSSVEAFAEAFLAGGADPTPPNTPPGHAMGTPRRSSYILSQHVLRPSLSADDLPPFLSDLESLDGREAAARPSQETTRGSSDVRRPSVSFAPGTERPLWSGGRGHTRHRSSRSYRSYRSYGRGRYASFTSGMAPHSSRRSFDTGTYSHDSVDDLSEVPMPQPLRVLRRRPGGDLRGVDHVGDLGPAPLRRSRSVGSLTTYTDSMRSSYVRSPGQDSSGFVDVVTSDYSRERDETFSLGAIAEQKPKRQLSLFSTHSSKPVMRPSFEAEAQKLAQIPDDVDDDGGVESALRKLEGKFEKRPARLSMEPVPAPAPAPVGSAPAAVGGLPIHASDEAATIEEKREHRHAPFREEDHAGPPNLSLPPPPPRRDLAERPSDDRLDVPPGGLRTFGGGAQSFLSGESGESYSSTPLLERGLTDDGHSRSGAQEWTNQSVFQDDDVPTPTAEDSDHGSSHPSYEMVRRTESMERMVAGVAMPLSPRQGTQISFLDDESDHESDLSSELSAELVEEEEAEEERPPALTRSNTVGSRLPSHPLGDSPTELRPPPPAPQPLRSHPPSPPMTLVQALQMSPETANIPEVHDHQVWEDKPLPPTPDTSRTTVAARGPSLESHDPTGTREALRHAPKVTDADLNRKFSVHLPFILAFDSDILAQQFTLIEKDALNEIDWKELIEMRWKNSCNNDARSWVHFLRDADAHGVEVVVARFNIMVKWAVSEIVLTQNLEERARCVIKYIHIAAHCRRYRNFATMGQIAVALSSNEVGRLSKTWALVPPSEVRTFKELEALVSPTRNFYTLRAEMEGVGISTADTGCIPFVGIYTHDLLFNAQRPSEIASSPTTAPLVNFERCRRAANIVKTLLRLLEASTLYSFQPIEGITERCLWMGALGDDEIRRHSEALE